jgi:hypothetical protein
MLGSTYINSYFHLRKLLVKLMLILMTLPVLLTLVLLASTVPLTVQMIEVNPMIVDECAL